MIFIHTSFSSFILVVESHTSFLLQVILHEAVILADLGNFPDLAEHFILLVVVVTLVVVVVAISVLLVARHQGQTFSMHHCS